MKKITFLAIALSFFAISCTNSPKETENEQATETKDSLINRIFALAEVQYPILVEQLIDKKPMRHARTLDADGSLIAVNKGNWTSGFFSGTLWYIYEYTQNANFKESALKFTLDLDSVKHIKWNHDVGFMMESSYGNAMRLTGNDYKEELIESAKSLVTRYRPDAKVIQSWDADQAWILDKGWTMPVIIDNLMNLKLLFDATKFTGDSSFYNIAVTHANTTIKHHFREDFSSYHVIDYDKDGDVLHKHTAQGCAHSSSWARGQAWGVYGYVETFSLTGDSAYLEQAKAIANYIMTNKTIPEDNVPYWDYNAPDIPDAPKDASAAAITACALLELQKHDTENKDLYMAYAEKILRTLASDKFLAKAGENGGFLLTHSVGNIHTGEDVNNALNYADYYFLEALLRWKTN